MSQVKNEIGNRYGRLVVISRDSSSRKGSATWKCQCDCGNIKTAVGEYLRNGRIKSCGCYQKEMATKANTIHGLSETSLFKIWSGIKGRCFNLRAKSYKYYGGRGITLCDEWLEFLPFYEWAMIHGYQKRLTIERVDNDGNYCPGNCVFATWVEQAHNQGVRKDNRTGHAGIHWNRKCKKYVVYINNNLKRIHLGSFVNIQDAATARKAAEIKYWGTRAEAEQTEGGGPNMPVREF
jgi:hypothetical protein